MEQDLEDMEKGNTGGLDKANTAEVEALRQRIKELESSEQQWQENINSHLKSEAALKYRIRELQLSEKNLLEEIQQLRMNLGHVENTIGRVKGRVRNLQTQFSDLVEEQERLEVKHKGKSQRLQNCLRIKEEEAKSQSEYFERCKQNQKQQIAMLREREAGLQNHIGRLEKDARDLGAAISVLAKELEETLRSLRDEMDAIFSRVPDSVSSRMEVADLKLLVDRAQQKMGSCLEEMLKSLLRRGGHSETEKQAKENRGGHDESFPINEKSCGLACELKPIEMKIMKPQGEGSPPEPEWLPKEAARRRQVANGMKNADAEASESLVVGNANTAAVLRNICLLFGRAPVKVSHVGGMKGLRGQGPLPVSKQVASNASWKPVAISAVQFTLPEYQSRITEYQVRSSHKMNFSPLSSSNSISQADGGGILGQTSETQEEEGVENPTLKQQGDKHKICAPHTEEVGQVNGGEERSLAEDGYCVKYQAAGNATVKLGNQMGKDPEAIVPVSRSLSQDASQVLGEMKRSRTKEQPVKPTRHAGMKGAEHKPLSNTGRKKSPPRHAKLQSDQGARGAICTAEDSGRSPGERSISDGEKTQPKMELLEQINLCLQRRDRQKEKRELERKGSAYSAERWNPSQGLTAQRERASPELTSLKDVRPLDIVSLRQDGNECLRKGLEQTKTANVYSQKTCALMQESWWQLCMLQEENHRYSLKIHALEEELDMYGQYILAVEETHVAPYQKHFAAAKVCSEILKKDLAGDSQGALGALWGKDNKNLSTRSFPSAAEQRDGWLEEQGASLETKRASSLEERRIKCFQLFSCLKDERNNFLKEVTPFLQNKEKCLEQSRTLEAERWRNLQRICLLEGDKASLLRRLQEAEGEHKRCAVFISELDECKNMWFQAVFELEEEKLALRNSMERTRNETCSQCFESQNMIANLKLEREKLVKIMVAWGIDPEEQSQSGGPVTQREAQGTRTLQPGIETEKSRSTILTAEKATQVVGLACCPVQDPDFEGRWGRCKGESKADNHCKHLLDPVRNLVPLHSQNSISAGQPLEMSEQTSISSHVPNPSSSSPPCFGKQPGRVDPQEMLRKESISESTRTMEEQFEKAKKELKILQEKLDQAKKDGQKWYVELGFAETRYEEVNTQLKDTLAELQRLKEAKVDPPKKAACNSTNRPQDLVEEKLIIQRLEQQALTFKAQRRDYGILYHQYEALQKKVELLQVQIKEKDEALQRSRSEAKLAAAPFKAKLACLVQKCHRRNCTIARLVRKLGERGVTEGTEEVEELLHDAVLAEYASAFAPEYKRELASPAFDPTNAPGVSHTGANEGVEWVIASVFPEADGSCSAHSSSVKDTASLLKLTSPEKIIDFHQELRKNHCPDYQIASLDQEGASSSQSSSCQRLQEATSITPPAASKRRCAIRLSSPAHSSLIKGPERLCRLSGATQNQTGNLHGGAFDQGTRRGDVLMNNGWISRRKPGGSASAKSHLSDMVSASNNCPSPPGEKMAPSRRGTPVEITPGIPAPVVSVHIIKTIGKSALMIGWERPVLDELGCSNGTFITGYKVYVDGSYHKSITSSACTKTVLDNLDLSAPFEIGVQSSGANGLASGKRYVQFRCCRTKEEAPASAFEFGSDRANRG